MRRSRIVLADSDADARRSISWVLKEHGFDVVSLASSDVLLERLDHEDPDVLLLDLDVLTGHGEDVLSRIKGSPRWKDLPVVILSHLPPDEASARALGLGAADHISKPVQVRDLIARIQAQIRALGALRSTRDALQAAEAEAARARRESDTRRAVVDILRSISGDLSPHETYAMLVRRVARALSLSHCSIILAQPGEPSGVVATSHEDPGIRDRVIQLDRYPELRAALEERRAILVDDVRTSPLFASTRAVWEREKIQVPVRSVLAVPFGLDTHPAGVFLLRRTAEAPPLTSDDTEFADTLIKAAASAIQRAQMVEATKADNARLTALAHTDPLTLVLNRRALFARLSSELERARRYSTIVTILMIDLDDFKAVNDTYGHQVGDEVLTSLAQLLQHAVRSVDVVARYGGEEFAIVLPETGIEGAVTFAERIREKIEAQVFTTPEKSIMLTVSIGVGSFPSQGVAEVEDLIARADEALYRAKAGGRNRVRT